MAEPKINPYNFVPLAPQGPERGAFPGWHRLAHDGYSGRLQCTLETLSPLFTADHHKAREDDTWLSFLRNSQNQPILLGTTLKGMVRAVYEALTNACLPLTATAGTSRKGGSPVRYEFAPLGEHEHSQCHTLDTLCPACRLFGVIHGNEVLAQGRLIFTDAILHTGQLTPGKIFLPELSSPKPHHYQIYSKTHQASGPIAGRKFFYHHAAQDNPVLTNRQSHSKRANGITEIALAGTRFTFAVLFHSLHATEFAHIVHCLVLDSGLGHKIGMGKPIGFGSCRIHIHAEQSAVYQGDSRYQGWQTPTVSLDIDHLKSQSGAMPPALLEVLRLNKPVDGMIGYLSYTGYDAIAEIDLRGRYRQRSTKPTPPVRSGVTVEEIIKTQKQGQRKSRAVAAQSTRVEFRKGEQIQVEVTKKDGDQYTVLIPGTGQELIHTQRYLPWEVGQRKKVTIMVLEADGRIKSIKP